MTFGSGPITGRLAAYSAGQPPRTANRAAMLDSVSPSCTTYLVLGLGAAAAARAALSVLVKMTSVLLPAVRVFACAGRTDALRPTATTDDQNAPGEHHARRLGPHTHSAVTFLPRGDQRRDAAGPDAEGTNQWEGKDLRGRHLRKVGTPDGLNGGATRQPQQEQREQREQGDREATLHSAAVVPADAAARTPGAVRAAGATAGGDGQPGKPRGWRQRGIAAARSRPRRRQRGTAGARRGLSGAGTRRSGACGRGAAGVRGCASGRDRGRTRQAGTGRVLRAGGPEERRAGPGPAR